MSRIADCFNRLGTRRALVSFITAGDPTVEHTVPAMHALVAGGTDILELGIPFSDPEAEGPAIQASSERALANGVRLSDVLERVAEFRTRDDTTPVVLMGYLNSVLAMADFAQRAAQAGVDGMILVNLPPEEAGELQRELAARDIDLVFLVAPTTTAQRSESIMAAASGFVYYVSLKGITGASHLRADAVGERVAFLRSQQKSRPLPICVGFGIKDAETAAAVGAHADGVVVGSALVELMATHPTDVQACSAALQAAAAALREGLDSIESA